MWARGGAVRLLGFARVLRGVDATMLRSTHGITASRVVMEKSGWMSKIGGMFGMGGKDGKEGGDEDLTDSKGNFTVGSYFGIIDKVVTMRKFGMSGPIDKMFGKLSEQGFTKEKQDELWDSHTKIKSVLTESELSAPTAMFSNQRREEIAAQSGTSLTAVDMVFTLYARAKHAQEAIARAKAEGKAPTSEEEIKKLLNMSPQSNAMPAGNQTSNRTLTSNMGVRSDRFTPSPKKLIKRGRNDMVTITNGESTQTIKWKKAEILVQSGKWSIVE